MYADERESEKFSDWLKISEYFPSLYSPHFKSRVKSTKKWLITLLVRKEKAIYELYPLRLHNNEEVSYIWEQ